MTLEYSIGMPRAPELPQVTFGHDGAVVSACWREVATEAKAFARGDVITVHHHESRQRAQGFHVDDFVVRMTSRAGAQAVVFGDFSIGGASFAELLPLPGHVLIGMADHQLAVSCADPTRVRCFATEPYFHHLTLAGPMVLMKTELTIVAFDLQLQKRWEYEAPMGAPFSFQVDVELKRVTPFDDLEQEPMPPFDLLQGPGGLG